MSACRRAGDRVVWECWGNAPGKALRGIYGVSALDHKLFHQTLRPNLGSQSWVLFPYCNNLSPVLSEYYLLHNYITSTQQLAWNIVGMWHLVGAQLIFIYKKNCPNPPQGRSPTTLAWRGRKDPAGLDAKTSESCFNSTSVVEFGYSSFFLNLSFLI